jgi:hypothetical protein
MPYAVLVTSIDNSDHWVTDDNMSAGMDGGIGQYVTLCGDSITHAALVEPPGRMCPRCAALMRQLNFSRSTERPHNHHRYSRHRRPSLVCRVRSRLFAGRGGHQ